MNTSYPKFYTNEAPEEYLRTLGKVVFTEQQIAGFSEETIAIVRKQQAHCAEHPPTRIYRYATQGSQTRNSGVIEQATSDITVKQENGQQVRVALVGDFVTYADGSKAQITTGAGEGNSNVALVGSRLDNGDEIINTPQGSILILERKGVPRAADFLPAREG